MLAWQGTAPSDEATYNFLQPGMPELSGIRQRLNSCVEEVSTVSMPEIYSRLGVAIPLYIYPGEGCWDALFEVMTRHPSVDFHLVVNPANGPGGIVPDSNYIRDVARLNTFSNCTIYGYVHVSWAARKASLVEEDITTWSQWKQHKEADIHIDGIFIDEAPSELDKLEYMAKLYKHVQEAIGDEAPVWTNPGVSIDESFYEVADLVNSHENTHLAWKQSSTSSKAKSTAMIHSYTGSLDDQRQDIETLKKAGYHSVLITTANCYTSFSGYLGPLLEAIDGPKE